MTDKKQPPEDRQFYGDLYFEEGPGFVTERGMVSCTGGHELDGTSVSIEIMDSGSSAVASPMCAHVQLSLADAKVFAQTILDAVKGEEEGEAERAAWRAKNGFTITREQAEAIVENYCDDPAPPGAVERLTRSTIELLREETATHSVGVAFRKWASQDEIDNIIYPEGKTA